MNDPSIGRVLVVDDLEPNRQLLSTILGYSGHEVVEADSGEAGLALVQSRDPDVILLDVMMPGIDGFETCRRIKADPASRLTPVVLVTSLNETADRVKGIEAGADDFLSKPVDAQELIARVKSLVRLRRFTQELDSAEAVIVSLALTIEARDAYTEGHCRRLSEYSTRVGRALGLPDDDLEALTRGGFLHDVGKVGIPDRILLNEGPLAPEDFEVMKTHTVIGDRLCGGLRSLRRVRPIVRHHHEKLDGSGYPDGLAGDAIPFLAQIMGVVDVFDALTTNRPYQRARGVPEALQVLDADVARGWRRRDLVDCFKSTLPR